MSAGTRIIEGLTNGSIIRGVCACDEEHPVVIVFSANAAEQIEGIVWNETFSGYPQCPHCGTNALGEACFQESLKAQIGVVCAEKDRLKKELNERMDVDQTRTEREFQQRDRIKELEAERDAANALVDRLAGALEKREAAVKHADHWNRIWAALQTEHNANKAEEAAMFATEAENELKAALAEVAKSLSPRTTKNTKPQ